MSPFLQFVLLLAILLFVTKLAGYLSTLLRQPAVLGELLVGLFLGPSLLDLVHLPVFQDESLGHIVYELAEVGVLLLMFVAGLELHLSDLARNMRVSALAGSLGVLAPVGLGWGVGRLFGMGGQAALFLGLVLGATSVSISAQTLMELKMLRSRVGMGLLGAAVFDDILVILLLSTFIALLSSNNGWLSVLWILVRMVAFLALSAAFGQWVLPLIVRRVAALPISQGVLTLALVVIFAYSIAAEMVGGMAGITGAFLAGLMFSRSPEKERLERGMHAVAYSLFVPLFFVNIGLSVDTHQIGWDTLWLMIGVIVAAVVGKLVGAGGGARLAGLSWREAAQLGTGMISRGEVGLILASVGVQQGLLSTGIFSVIVGMVIVSTVITPPALRLLFAHSQPHQSPKIVSPSEERS